MFETLIVDADTAHAQKLIGALKSRQLRVDLVRTPGEAIQRLLHSIPGYDFVIINVSDTAKPWPAILGELHEACRPYESHTITLFLCVSTRDQEPRLELEIERKGARYVRER